MQFKQYFLLSEFTSNNAYFCHRIQHKKVVTSNTELTELNTNNPTVGECNSNNISFYPGLYQTMLTFITKSTKSTTGC